MSMENLIKKPTYNLTNSPTNSELQDRKQTRLAVEIIEMKHRNLPRR